jgi:hypothetical protein
MLSPLGVTLRRTVKTAAQKARFVKYQFTRLFGGAGSKDPTSGPFWRLSRKGKAESCLNQLLK